MAAPAQPLPSIEPASPRRTWRSVVLRFLLHAGFLLVAVGCLAAYEHFSAERHSRTAVVSLVAAGGFGFLPLRDVIRVFFRVEGMALHLVHLIGGLGLLALPLTGVVSGTPVLAQAAMAPFAMMGAAQALMHANQPRNASQAAALQRFVTSLPEVAALSNRTMLSSPAGAERAVAALTDVVAKAQALGQTELQSDPGFQNALKRVSTRFGTGLGLDAVDLALDRLAANPATAGAVPAIRKKVAAARRTLAGAGQ